MWQPGEGNKVISKVPASTWQGIWVIACQLLVTAAKAQDCCVQIAGNGHPLCSNFCLCRNSEERLLRSAGKQIWSVPPTVIITWWKEGWAKKPATTRYLWKMPKSSPACEYICMTRCTHKWTRSMTTTYPATTNTHKLISKQVYIEHLPSNAMASLLIVAILGTLHGTILITNTRNPVWTALASACCEPFFHCFLLLHCALQYYSKLSFRCAIWKHLSHHYCLNFPPSVSLVLPTGLPPSLPLW